MAAFDPEAKPWSPLDGRVVDCSVTCDIMVKSLAVSNPVSRACGGVHALRSSQEGTSSSTLYRKTKTVVGPTLRKRWERTLRRSA